MKPGPSGPVFFDLQRYILKEAFVAYLQQVVRDYFEVLKICSKSKSTERGALIRGLFTNYGSLKL